jgi:phospholipid-transporting ATPase
MSLEGSLTCDSPNEFLDRWDTNVTIEKGLEGQGVFNCGLKNLLMRGCTLRNTDYCMGYVIYAGPESKIMMNAKKPPTKVSGVQKKMNLMLYSVFAFQLTLVLVFALLSVMWTNSNQAHTYLKIEAGGNVVGMFFLQYLTYWVAYSHLIPISLYVVLEMVKMGQAKLIGGDVEIYHKETGFSVCSNSDLIEEMGQVEFIFSDKTGTLTCNVMDFKQCSVNGKVYEELADAQEIMEGKHDGTEKDIRALRKFFKLMAVCHTVVIDVDKKTGKPLL